MNTWIDETWLFLEPKVHKTGAQYVDFPYQVGFSTLYDYTAVVEAFNLCMER